MSQPNDPIQNRYEFVFLFDIADGNPNGDPDADNLPRTDPETNQGLVTDVCLKRKIRNYVQLAHQDESPHRIYVKEKAVLNRVHEEAHQGASGGDPKKFKKDELARVARDWMCRHFYDVRCFGAVMSTGKNCGQVRGPVQITFARSIEPVTPLSYTITRMAVTTEKEAAKQEGANRTMGRKHAIPYGLYRAHGFISPFLARETGFSEVDLELFWLAMINMFEHDRSAARGTMAARKFWVFRHDSALGNAPAQRLLESITVTPTERNHPARSFGDYHYQVGETPSGVTLLEKL